MATRVLVVDDDPWTQRMVSAVLGRGGHLVDLASDGWEGLIRAGHARPDLVIVEIRLPTTDGWSFVNALRARPETADVPALFLGAFSVERRPLPDTFRSGQDGWLDKPFRLEQLEDRVRALLSHEPVHDDPPGRLHLTAALPAALRPSSGPAGTTDRGMPAGTSRKAVLMGHLDAFGLSSVLIVLELERKSGVLFLQGTAGLGRIALRDGRVIRASVEGRGTLSGALAVYDLLTWGQGRFEFNPGTIEGEDEIGSSTSFLLMEGARLQDERSEHTKARN